MADSKVDGQPKVSIWLSVKDMMEFTDLLATTAPDLDMSEAENAKQGRGIRQQIEAVCQFCVDRQIVTSWSFVDRKGKALNPNEISDYEKLNVQDYYRLREAITKAVNTLPKD